MSDSSQPKYGRVIAVSISVPSEGSEAIILTDWLAVMSELEIDHVTGLVDPAKVLQLVSNFSFEGIRMSCNIQYVV